MGALSRPPIRTIHVTHSVTDDARRLATFVHGVGMTYGNLRPLAGPSSVEEFRELSLHVGK